MTAVLILTLILISTPVAASGPQPPLTQEEAIPLAPGSESPEARREAASGGGSDPLARIPEPWRSGFEQIESDLKAGRWQAAASAAGRLAERMATLFPAGLRGRVMVASALAQQAVAEAEAGRPEEALRHWQIAQNLNPGLRQAPLAGAFGETGAWLEARRLRSPGALDAPPPAGAEITPPAPLSVPPPEPPPELLPAWGSDPLEVEVVVDVAGEVRSPVVLGGGELPGKVFFGLAALQRWRFRPALADGVPVKALLRLDGLKPRSFAFAAARSPKLGPVHRLLLGQRFQEARDAVQPLVGRAIGCLSAGPQHPVCDLGRPLMLRAVAEAGLGRAEDALWSWHLAHSFLSRPAAGDLAVYGGEPARLLAEPPCAVEPRTCGAVRLRDARGITPPQAIAAPPLRLPPELAARVGADRLIASLWIDAGGRVRGAVMRAGHSAAAGHRALAAVRDWRFEPARHGGKPHGGKPRGGEPVAVVHDVSIPLATAAPAEQVVRWRQEMDGLRERLAAGGGQEAYEEARRRVAEIAGAIGDGGSDLLARAVAQQAQAEAGLGLADAAVWHWHAAQNLAVEYRASDLAVFGAAGDLLDGHRLRQPGEGLRETSDPDRAPRKLVGAMPRYPRETARRVDGGPPDIAIIELIVDENGLPQAPVVLAGRSPTRLYAALEAVREWRFEPADRSGTAVPVLRRLKLPLTFTIPIEEMALVRDADRLVRLAVKVAGPRPRLAGCYWRTARSLEPALAIADPSSLGPAAAALAESAALPRDRWSLDASADGVGTGTGPSPIAVGGDVEYPHKIYLPQPQYSPEALRARIQGTVITQMFTDEEGYVSGLEVLTGLPKGLNVEVARAFCQGRFEPTTRAGKRVRVFFVETANFRVR